MDASSKYAEWEQRGQGTLASNPHEGGEKPSGLDKAAGKLEEVTGKVMGDKELHARGLADQGASCFRLISDSSWPSRTRYLTSNLVPLMQARPPPTRCRT